MKLFAIILLAFSTAALADINAQDMKIEYSAFTKACDHGSDHDCAIGWKRYEAFQQRYNQQLVELMSRTPEERRRRNQILEEEKWRQEYYKK